MAKTYEAILRSQGPLEEEGPTIVPSSSWMYHDLKSTRAMGDLQQRVSLMTTRNNCKVFHFVSSREKEGVSTIVANLAEAIAHSQPDRHIMLIDLNLRNPTLHLAFNLPLAPGLSDTLASAQFQAHSIHTTKLANLNFLPAGKAVSNNAATIEQKKFTDLISVLRDRYDTIIIDSPPLFSSPDSLSAAIASDTSLLIIQANRVTWEVVQRGKEYLARNGCTIGGAVLNRFQHVIPGWIYDRL